MRKIVQVIALVLFLSLPAMAQKAPTWDVYGGYSYMRADFGGVDQPLQGWDFAVGQNVNSWFGGVLDFTGHYAHPGGVNVNVHTFAAGPRFSYRKVKNVVPFAQVLLGGVRGSRGYLGATGLSQTKIDFGFSAGGGLDLKFNKHVAVRIIQADYLVTPFLGLRQDNLRASAGLVFYLGGK